MPEPDIPPIPLSLEIEFIPDRRKEDVPSEPDIPPFPLSFEVEFIPDWQHEDLHPEPDIPPIPLSLEIDLIHDRQQDGGPDEPDIPPIPLSLEMGFIVDWRKEGASPEPDIEPLPLSAPLSFIQDSRREVTSDQDVSPNPKFLEVVSQQVSEFMIPTQTPPKRRPRTGSSFFNLLKGRRSEPSPASSPPSYEQPSPHLPLKDLIEALTPPAVLSLAHARALVLAVQTETPQLEVLMPVLSRLCAPRVPSALLATGIEVLSAYSASQTQSLKDVERATLFALLRSSDPHWTADTWAPRLRCLSQLTRNGNNIAGYETAFLAYTKACISSAFEGLLSDNDSDRASREKFLEDISVIMRETLTKNAALYTEQDMQDVLHFFEGFVQHSLDNIPAGFLSETTSIPSSPGVSPSLHRRNTSSISSYMFTSGKDLSPSWEPISPLDRSLLPISLYISALDMYRAQVTFLHLPPIVCLLVRIIAVHLSLLPRLSVWPVPQHKPRIAEESALTQLFGLLAGPHADTVAENIKRLMSSMHPQEALGAFRTVRTVLRDAAKSRMARIALRGSKYDIEQYAPSGQPVISEEYTKVLQRAHEEQLDVPSLTVDRLVKDVGKAVRLWVAKSNAEKVLEEALGIVKDVLTEASDRVEGKDDGEDYSAINVDEGHLVGTILNEAVKYVQRMRLGNIPPLPIDKTSVPKIPFLPIDNPSVALTPLLLTLCTQLALPLSTPMTPSLPSILLSITSYLTDAQTAMIPTTMHALGLLMPTSMMWLDNISDLFTELIHRERPITTREVFSVAETIHSDLTGIPPYRRKLGRLVCKLAERTLAQEDLGNGLEVNGDESWTRLCTNELVLCILESVQNEGEVSSMEEKVGEDITERLIGVFLRHVAVGCSCISTNLEAPVVLPHQAPLQEAPVRTTPGVSVFPSNSSTSISSPSESLTQDKYGPPQQRPLDPVVQPLMSMPRKRDSEGLVTIRSEVESLATDNCRPVYAAVALVNAFKDLSFSASPLPAQSIRLFRAILSALKKAKCTKARLVLLQLLMRLRADRDHRLYILSNLDDDIDTLAALVDRSRSISGETPSDEGEVRARSISRDFWRGQSRRDTESRSRSRPAASSSKLRGQLWMVPESLPFDIPVSKPSRHGVATYDANTSQELEELNSWLPVSDYVLVLVDILRNETDWEILSYVLCHLPVQLVNKHFFCGPKTKSGVVALLLALCTVTFKGESANIVTQNMPKSLRLRDAQGLVFHTLSVLVSYQRIFDERKHHDMLVEAFLAGLSSQPSTVKVCLNALSICAYELPSSITKNLSRIMENLSRIMTNAEIAVHILDFVAIVGSIPSLYSNFREQEFKMVFAAAVTYIHYHNSPDTRGLSGRESFALSQHVLAVAYHVIYVWFLAVALPDRPKHVQFLARRLVLANEAKGVVDEPTEVCFDWLARYTYATADPNPVHSLLGDILMNPPHNENDEPMESSLSSKTWLWGSSLVTIRTLPKLGWIQVASVRPSGVTKFLCKSENFSQVNPSDVDLDLLSDDAILTSGHDHKQTKNVSNPDDNQTQASANERAAQGVRNPFVPSGEQREPPGPMTTYIRSQSLSIDPSFFALQLSQYPHLPKSNAWSRRVPSSPQLDTLLRILTHTPVVDMRKIAILYVAPGQKEEREILGNHHGSPAYTRFLEGIGRLICVRDQRDIYTGGIVPETDGEYAYAWWDDIVQVVYHTTTLMPNLSEDPIFVNKKRHVGNDKVRIIWNDSGLPFAHHTIKSAFNFVNLIIEPHSIGTVAAFSNNKHEHESFKVTMQRMEGMPAFGPIGDYKLVSAENLAPLLRQVSLLADVFSEVYEATDKDTSKQEYVNNWRRRLQYINKFRSRMESEPLSEVAEDSQDSRGQHEVRDFTRFF